MNREKQVNDPTALRGMTEGFGIDQAVAEAARCLLCHEPPCSAGCPAGTDPGTFIRKLRMNNLRGAIRTIKENNVLGGACGALCPASRLCEKACSASGLDRPIRIGKIQQFLVDLGWKMSFRVFEEPWVVKSAPRKESVAVVGAGPAGLACGAELRKQGFGVTLFESRPEPGGVLRYGVPSFRFGTDLLEREIADVRSLGVEIRCSSPVRGQGAIEKLLEKGFSAVFVGVGLWGGRDGEAGRRGLWRSVDFLSALREGKESEVGRTMRGKAVAVIGGGSVAVDCARSALRLGARDVFLVYRRSFGQMPAEQEETFGALREGVHFFPLNRPAGTVEGPRENVKGVRLVRTRLDAPDESGRRKPVDMPGSEWILEADAVIEATGELPDEDSPRWYPSVRTTGDGRIVVQEGSTRTSADRIFAGGDIVRGPGLVVWAVKDGKDAARAIMERLGRPEGGPA
jgi:NADPH-dependent glutamate synthase beta subunit-like oxidoreductase